jgi:hypothetical protein
MERPAGGLLLMNVGFYRMPTLELPGRAGELRAAGATAALIREFGDNYGVYHEFLAGELEKLGERPRATRDGPPSPEFVRHWRRADEIVRCEIILRACRAYRKQGRSLVARLDLSRAFVDERHRLLSVESGEPMSGASGRHFAPQDPAVMPHSLPGTPRE